DVDIRGLGPPGLLGPSILLGQHYDTPLTSTTVTNWSQIAAVEYDEPYNTGGVDAHLGSCTSPPTAYIQPIDTQLSARAAELKSLNPRARFWVNFSPAEARWIASCMTPQVFNRTDR